MRWLETFRARLTLRYIAILGAALVLFSALLYVSLSRALYGHHDAELANAATQLQRMLEGRSLDDNTLSELLTTSQAANALVMIRDGNGTLRYRSALLQVSEPNIGLHEALVHAAAHGQSDPQFFTTSLERSGIVRFICVPVATQPSGYIQIGRPLGDVAPTLRTFRNASLVLLPAVILLASYGGWVLAGRALAPVKDIGATLQAIQASDLSRRVTVTPPDRELQQLVTTVNQTLERLERSFETIRQFAADASHQLQTPLAVMQSSLELTGRGSTPSPEGLAGQLPGLVREMSKTLSDLQALALADADLASTRSGPIDFTETCRDSLDIVCALAETAGITVSAEFAPHLHVWGDAGRLKQVVLNLADNAVKYSRAGGAISLSLRHDGDTARLEVSDHGAGIEAEDVPRVFDRFFRASRTSDAGTRGTGLGLAIVRRIVEVHRGHVSVSSVPGSGSSFVVVLPLFESEDVRRPV